MLLKLNDKVCFSNIRTSFQREYDTKWSAEYLNSMENYETRSTYI